MFCALWNICFLSGCFSGFSELPFSLSVDSPAVPRTLFPFPTLSPLSICLSFSLCTPVCASFLSSDEINGEFRGATDSGWGRGAAAHVPGAGCHCTTHRQMMGDTKAAAGARGAVMPVKKDQQGQELEQKNCV